MIIIKGRHYLHEYKAIRIAFFDELAYMFFAKNKCGHNLELQKVESQNEMKDCRALTLRYVYIGVE